jgi:hypothetical protein
MKISDLIRDAVGVAGAALLVAGIALVSPPASLIVAGLMLMGGAWLSARGG